MKRTIEEVLATKGHAVYCVDAMAKVMDAVGVMNQHHIGSVVVMKDEKLLGIFTERDVLTRIVAPARDAREVVIHDVMTPELYTLTPQDSLSEAMELMTRRRCRHVPIVHDGELVGMLSIGDVTKALSENLKNELHELESYIVSPFVAS